MFKVSKVRAPLAIVLFSSRVCYSTVQNPATSASKSSTTEQPQRNPTDLPGQNSELSSVSSDSKPSSKSSPRVSDRSTRTKTSSSPKPYLDYNFSSYSNIKKFSDLPQEFGSNQHIAIDNELREKLRSALWKFKAPIRYAFAYGSGVFSQGAASMKSNPQIDLVFGVSHTEHWHSLNMKQYPEHYSGLKWFGSGAVSYIQDNFGAGLYYNPYVEVNGLRIKYGVVNIDTLLRDLSEWDTLYLAGRLHKPVKILRDEPQVRFLNQANLISSLRTALLLLPENFTERELYTTIAGISYMGDPRMKFGENPNKVRNIVDNQFLNFRRLYSPLMDELPNIELESTCSDESSSTKIEIASMAQDMDPVKRGNMVLRLPKVFKSKLYSRYSGKFSESRSEPRGHDHAGRTISEGDSQSIKEQKKGSRFCSEFDQNIAKDPRLMNEMGSAIEKTVGWSSAIQSAKGLLTAGLVRSIKYSSEKLKKSKVKD